MCEKQRKTCVWVVWWFALLVVVSVCVAIVAVAVVTLLNHDAVIAAVNRLSYKVACILLASTTLIAIGLQVILYFYVPTARMLYWLLIKFAIGISLATVTGFCVSAVTVSFDWEKGFSGNAGFNHESFTWPTAFVVVACFLFLAFLAAKLQALQETYVENVE